MNKIDAVINLVKKKFKIWGNINKCSDEGVPLHELMSEVIGLIETLRDT